MEDQTINETQVAPDVDVQSPAFQALLIKARVFDLEKTIGIARAEQQTLLARLNELEQESNKEAKV